MRRAAPMLVGIVAVAVLAVAMMGAEAQGGPLVVAVPGVLGALAWAWHNSHRSGTELRWATRAAVADAQIVPIVGDRPTPFATVAHTQRASHRQVTAALARFEARQWVASPWFGAGVGFCVLQVWLFGWVWSSDVGSWREWFVLMPIMAHPMVGMVVIGAHHAVSRGRRDGVEELFAACPADESVRTVAQLWAGWVPAAVVAAFVAATSVTLAIDNTRVDGSVDGRALADMLTAVVLAVCGSALGVALARWAPWRLVPIVVVAALVPLIVALGNIGEPHWSNSRQLSTWPRYPGYDLLFTDPPEWWHLLWIVALGALVVWLALVHANRSRPMMLAGVAIAVVAAGAAIAQTRPLSVAAADRLASMVAEPELHQTCRSAPRIEVCVYEGYEDYADVVLARWTPVAADNPRWPEHVTFRQVFDGDLDALGPEVADALDGRSVPRGLFRRLAFPAPADP